MSSLKDAGIQVVGISYDSVEILKKFSDKREITFPLLSDPDSRTILAYALKNHEMDGKKIGDFDAEGVPYPGTLIIDQDGVIRAKLFVEGYRQRHSIDALREAAERVKSDR